MAQIVEDEKNVNESLNITPLTKYIRLLTEYQILIFAIQPKIEIFDNYQLNQSYLKWKLLNGKFE